MILNLHHFNTCRCCRPLKDIRHWFFFICFCLIKCNRAEPSKINCSLYIGQTYCRSAVSVTGGQETSKLCKARRPGLSVKESTTCSAKLFHNCTAVCIYWRLLVALFMSNLYRSCATWQHENVTAAWWLSFYLKVPSSISPPGEITNTASRGRSLSISFAHGQLGSRTECRRATDVKENTSDGKMNRSIGCGAPWSEKDQLTC